MPVPMVSNRALACRRQSETCTPPQIFNAISACSVVALSLSYALPIGLRLAHGQGGFIPGTCGPCAMEGGLRRDGGCSCIALVPSSNPTLNLPLRSTSAPRRPLPPGLVVQAPGACCLCLGGPGVCGLLPAHGGAADPFPDTFLPLKPSVCACL